MLTHGSVCIISTGCLQGTMKEKEDRIEELEEALRESVKITAEREMLLMEQKMQIDASQSTVCTDRNLALWRHTYVLIVLVLYIHISLHKRILFIYLNQFVGKKEYYRCFIRGVNINKRIDRSAIESIKSRHSHFHLSSTVNYMSIKSHGVCIHIGYSCNIYPPSSVTIHLFVCDSLMKSTFNIALYWYNQEIKKTRA